MSNIAFADLISRHPHPSTCILTEDELSLVASDTSEAAELARSTLIM